MQIVYKKLTEIKPYINNPRNNEESVEDVANSIKEFGFKIPIVIDSNGEIITGHTRYKASKKIGLDEVPCIIAEDNDIIVDIKQVPQDIELAKNQEKTVRCGDNGIFKGMPLTMEQLNMSNIARQIYKDYPSDGKYIITENKLIVCQSNAKTKELEKN